MNSFSFDADIVTAAFLAVDTNTSITHTLNRIPQAAFVVYADTKACRVYKGTAAWTSTTLSLRSNVASVGVTLLVV